MEVKKIFLVLIRDIFYFDFKQNVLTANTMHRKTFTRIIFIIEKNNSSFQNKVNKEINKRKKKGKHINPPFHPIPQDIPESHSNIVLN